MPDEQNSAEVWQAYDNGLTIRSRVESVIQPVMKDDQVLQKREVFYQVFELVGPSTTIEVRDRLRVPRRDRVPRRIRLCDALFSAVDLEGLCDDPAFLPTAVAVRGPPYIATYLAGVHGEPETEIAERLDVTKQTVTQYLSDVTTGRR